MPAWIGCRAASWLSFTEYTDVHAVSERSEWHATLITITKPMRARERPEEAGPTGLLKLAQVKGILTFGNHL